MAARIALLRGAPEQPGGLGEILVNSLGVEQAKAGERQRCRSGDDASIAAIALAASAEVATRDTGGFAGCGLTLIDPWAAG